MEKIFIFDLETTGVKFWKNGVHQISGGIVIDGVMVEDFNFHVKPHEKAVIEEEALEIANVTRQEVEAYPTMYGVYKKIEAMLSKYVDKFNKKDKFYLAGFNNAGFDNPFFRAFFTQNATTQKEADYGNYFGSWFWSDSFDVMILASYYLRKERSEMPNFQLKTVAKQLGIEVDETKLHDAKYDIYLTYEIFKIVTNQ